MSYLILLGKLAELVIKAALSQFNGFEELIMRRFPYVEDTSTH